LKRLVGGDGRIEVVPPHGWAIWPLFAWLWLLFSCLYSTRVTPASFEIIITMIAL
jgi:hypothetical protein